MILRYLSLFIFLNLLLLNAKGFSIHVNMPELNVNGEKNDHLKYDKIIKMCESRSKICASNDTNICAVRLRNGKMEYEDFENSCYLFLANMCNYPGREFNIVSGDSCDNYLQNRRRSMENKNKTTTVESVKNNLTTAKPYLRKETFSTLYEVETAFDFHTCPLSCPDIYSPVCVSCNRGYGLYFKFYTFVNHCEGDLYYCKHWEEFSPPPDEDEIVNSSPLSWSYCGSSRYLQFARFSEVTSSMGHYGWLAGDHRYSHIVDPHERKPGFG